MSETSTDSRIIGVVEDDESVGLAIRSLLRSLGFRVEVFGSAEALLGFSGDLACLIVDVRLPGMSGLDLQQRLVAARVGLPIVFISAHDDPVSREQALAAGALAFLRKPFSEDALMNAVRSGLARGRKGSPIEKGNCHGGHCDGQR